MSNEIKSFKVNDKLYGLIDSNARQRLESVEYQAVTTDLAYEHKDLPEGEKVVTVQSDGVFGNTAYVSVGKDLIPRKAFNRTFPYNGITLTRSNKIYHIEGLSTADGSVFFGETASETKIKINEDISGKAFKLITFANELTGKNLSAGIKFYDENNTVVNVLNSKGELKNQITYYVANTVLSQETIFSIPENVNIAYMQVYISFKAAFEFNHDFQVYIVESEATQSVANDEPNITIDKADATNVFSLPYPSTIVSNTPISEYIKYIAKNAKGDKATYLTPETFGAIGDGFADDSEAIAACLAEAAVTKQTVFMAKTYLTSLPIDISYSDLQIIINDIVYNGANSAVKISGQRNTIKIHSVTSSGVGVCFSGESDKNVTHNDLEINTVTSGSHGITFICNDVSVYQNVVRFNYIKAGGSGCYGIGYFYNGTNTFVSENSFYGGQISKCEWAVYGGGGNSKFYGIEVEGEVEGGFYIDKGYIHIFHPRIAESQRDGSLPIYKFIETDNTNIYDSSGININQIDLTEAVDVFVNASGNTNPLHEYTISKINGTITSRIPAVGVSSQKPNVYCTEAFVWGKFLIMKPHMAYRKEITTETLDTRLIGRTEETDADINALSQLPTKFVVNTVNSEVYLHESYCAFGFSEFEIEQANGFTCKVYDKLDNLIFDGTELGDGVYKFKVYKDCDRSLIYGAGLLRRDFLGHYWEVTKSSDTVI